MAFEDTESSTWASSSTPDFWATNSQLGQPESLRGDHLPSGSSNGVLRWPYLSEEHRVLWAVLRSLSHRVSFQSGDVSIAYALRLVYQSFWLYSDWIPYYGVDKNTIKQKLRSNHATEWIQIGDNKITDIWKLSQAQFDALKADSPPLYPYVFPKEEACAKVFRRFERTYTCRTCARDSSSVLCLECFNPEAHEGHEVLFGQSFSFGAACDCNDNLAWKPGVDLGCKHHQPPDQATVRMLERPLGFITEVEEMPDRALQSLYFTIVTCLEFLVNTLQYSPLPNTLSNLPKNIEEMQELKGGTEEPPESREGPWSVVMWADEKHVAKEVARQLRDALGISMDRALRYTKQADEIGRKCVLVTPNPVLAYHTASMFQQVDIGVTLRLTGDVHREDMCGMVISWLKDMCTSSVCSDPQLFRRLLHRALSEPRESYDGGELPPDLANLVPDPSVTSSQPRFYGAEPTRLDWLLRLDGRLWRRAKWEMRVVYSTLYGLDTNVKKQLVSRFAANYVELFEQYLFRDRELDTNLVFSIAYMVFGNGQACAYAAEHVGLYSTILQVARAWYSNTDKEPQLVMPPQYVDRIQTDTSAFRNKKAMTIFGHVRVLFRYEPMQKLVVRTSWMINDLLDLAHLFVGIQPQHRVLESHIEFEVDWPRSFSILGELARCCRDFGECFQYATPEVLLRSLSLACRQICLDMTLGSSRLDPEKFEYPAIEDVDDVIEVGSSFKLIQHNVALTKAFSFHHYLHFAFAEMLKNFATVMPFDKDGLCEGFTFPQTVEASVFAAASKEETERMKLLLIEWPMQTHVVLAQIRAEMWKKNGVAMRGQSHHYRDIAIRESTIDQEFFLLQFGLCIMSPLKFITALIDRFGLSAWFQGDISAPEIWHEADSEPKHMINLLEDFMQLVIHLVTDTVAVNGWDQEKIIRRHVIHQLVLTNLGYSELIRKIPERANDRRSLVPILNDVATFRPATEKASGVYVLKDECYAEVDPYWRHYTRNDQRNAAAKLQERMKKEEGEGEEEVLLFPQTPDIPSPGRPFSELRGLLEGPVATDLVTWITGHCTFIVDLSQWPGDGASPNYVPQLDYLLELALQLALILLSVAPDTFASRAVYPHSSSRSMTLFKNLWFMQVSDEFKPFKPKIDHIMNELVKRLPAHHTNEYRAMRQSSLIGSPDKKKVHFKATAAARQQALMAEFAKKQASFAALMSEDEEDEEMEESADDDSLGQCIVCQEAVTSAHPGGMMSLLQPSRILRDVVHERDWYDESLSAPVCLDNATRHVRLGVESAREPKTTDGYPYNHMRFGVHVGACNHIMHESCMAVWFEQTRFRHSQQVQRHQPENAVRMEFLCPLCKSIGNILVPLDTTHAELRPMVLKDGRPPSLSERIRSVSEEGLIGVSDSAKIWDHHVETGELTPWFTDCNFSAQSLDPQYRRTTLRSVSRMIERARGLLRPLSEQSLRIRAKKVTMYIPDDVVAYTISVYEVAQRGCARRDGAQSVAEQLSETNLRMVKHLIGWLQLELDLYFGPHYDRTALRVGMFARFLPDWYRASTLPSPLLLRNPLGIVIETAAIAPDLLHPVIVMSYFATVTRVMLGLAIYVRRCLLPKTKARPRITSPEEPEAAEALSIFGNFRTIMHSVIRNAGPFTDAEVVLSLITDEELSKLLYTYTLPFLRRASIIYYAVTNTYPQPIPKPELDLCEYSRLLSLLAIPHPRETLQNPSSTETPIVGRWITQWTMQGRYVPSLEYPGTYELVRLPEKWETMVLFYLDKKCTVCNSKPTFPAVCLFCGKLVCLGGDCCAEGEQGECNIHVRECGGVVGMFVDIKRWVILCLYAGTGSFTSMPYLDAHGELDLSMRRGHRQYLHVGRWDELRRNLWLNHCIPHLTARKLELISDGGGWGCL